MAVLSFWWLGRAQCRASSHATLDGLINLIANDGCRMVSLGIRRPLGPSQKPSLTGGAFKTPQVVEVTHGDVGTRVQAKRQPVNSVRNLRGLYLEISLLPL